MSNDPYKTHSSERPKRSRTNIWIALGAIFLIILLILWLTFADLTGNTDVAAFISPVLVSATKVPLIF